MHTATLLHDDVVDESDMRRGKLAARMLWGNEASVLVGDFLLGQAFKMMVEVGSLRALDILSTAAAVIAEGEVLQLSVAKNTETTEDEYLAVIRGKTAELFAAACEVGPVIAERIQGRRRRLPRLRPQSRHRLPAHRRRARLWRRRGQARQEHRRRLSRGQDHPAGRALLPARQRRASAPSGAGPCRMARSAAGDIEEAQAIMRRHRALDDTIARAEHYARMAKDALGLFPASAMKQALNEAVDFCVARAH